MSDTEDDQELYEVERILAERQRNNEGTKYLVKWKGYPDEECTWEGSEAFTQDETLRDWRKQQASGDVLDEVEDEGVSVNNIGGTTTRTSEPDKDFLFKDDENMYRNELGEADEASSRSDESDTTTSTDDESGRPTKRARIGLASVLTPNPKPATKKKSVLEERIPQRAGHVAAYGILDANKESRGDSSKSTMNSQSLSNLASREQKRTTTGVFLDKSIVKSSVTTTSRLTPPARLPMAPSASKPSSHLGQPAKFHLPDLGQRPRNTQTVGPSSTTMPKNSVGAGQKFRSQHHMNNAQKKMREKAAPTAPIHTFDPSRGLRPSAPPAQRAEVDEPDSPLFFPWDEEVETRASKELNDEADEAVTSTNGKRLTKSLSQHISSAFMKLRPEKTVTGLTTSNLPHNKDQDQDHAMGRSMSVPVQVVPTKDKASTTLHHQPIPVIHTLSKQQVDESGHLPLDDLSIDTESAVILHPSRRTMIELRTGNFSGPSDTLNERVPPRHPLLGYDPPPTPSAERDGYATGWIDPSLENVPPDEIVVAWNGTKERRWRRGDIVLELFMEHEEVGDIKLLGIPWAIGSNIVRLKERDAYKLRIDFRYKLNRSRYDHLSKQKWFSTLARGAVEPFTDTNKALSSLANHLEIHDLAALWDHPHDDIMFVLYSCRSPEWQDFDGIAPRTGDTGLQILIRQKFQESNNNPKTAADERLPRRPSLPNNNQVYRSPSRDREERGSRDRKSPSPTQPRSRRPSMVPSFEMPDAVQYGAASRQPNTDLQSSRYPNTGLVSAVAPSPSDQLGHDLGMAVEIARTGEYTIERDHAVRPLTDAVGDCTTGKQDNVKSPVFECELTSLMTPPTKLSNKYNQSDIWVLFAHKGMNISKVDSAKEWLVAQGFPSNRILDKSASGTWTTLTMQLKQKSIGVIIFDKNYEFYQLGDLGRFLENNNLLCWQTNFASLSHGPLPLTRLFPYGTVMAICEGTFIEEPDRVLTILKWFKKASAAAPHHKLMIAPNIRTTLQDQAMLTRKPQISQLFLDAAGIVEELITGSTLGMVSTNDYFMSPGYDSGIDVVSPSRSPTSALNSAVVMPSWGDVHKDVPESAHVLPPLEQRSRAENVDKLLISYFAAWAQRHMTVYRSFMAIIIGDKKEGHEHVRQYQAKEFLFRYAMSDKEKEAAR